MKTNRTFRHVSHISGRNFVGKEYAPDDPNQFEAFLDAVKDVAQRNGQTVIHILDTETAGVQMPKTKARVRISDLPEDLCPAEGTVVVLTPVSKEVEIEVTGQSWSVTAWSTGKPHTREGRVSTTHQEGVMDAAIEALSILQDTEGWKVRLSISDANVARMVQGNMKSRKHPEKLEHLRELAEKHNITL